MGANGSALFVGQWNRRSYGAVRIQLQNIIATNVVCQGQKCLTVQETASTMLFNMGINQLLVEIAQRVDLFGPADDPGRIIGIDDCKAGATCGIKGF